MWRAYWTPRWPSPPMPSTATRSPAFDAFTERIDPTDRLVAGHTRRLDGEHSFHRAGVRMANAAGLDADADVTSRRIEQRLLGQLQLARADGLYCAIRRSGLRHFRLSFFGIYTPAVVPPGTIERFCIRRWCRRRR